jgi:protein disulfide-isomerase
MKRLALLLVAALALVPLSADDITTTDGTKYEQVTVVSHDDNGITIWHKGGQATIPGDKLPPDLQKQYGFKPKELWSSDYAASVADAKAQKKYLLLDFTGSDWCGYCMQLDKEVFTTPEFRAFALQNFVCVTVDFPHGKTLPAALGQQNSELSKKYGIEGFPTLIVTDTDGKELGRLVGYDPGSGPKVEIKKLEKIISKP